MSVGMFRGLGLHARGRSSRLETFRRRLGYPRSQAGWNPLLQHIILKREISNFLQVDGSGQMVSHQ